MRHRIWHVDGRRGEFATRVPTGDTGAENGDQARDATKT
jgi:hypothetical protein